MCSSTWRPASAKRWPSPLRRDVSAKLNRLPLRYFDAHQPGEIMSRVTNDVEKISTVIQSGLLQPHLRRVYHPAHLRGHALPQPAPHGVTVAAILGCTLVTSALAGWSQRSNARNMAAMGAVGAKVEEVSPATAWSKFSPASAL